MDTELSKTLEALQVAIRMEIDGRKFYEEASRKCEVKVGRELYEWLSGQEDWHRQKFEEIFKSIQQNKNWPLAEVIGGKKGNADEIFARVTKDDTCELKTARIELDTLGKALEIEDKTRVYYKKQGEAAGFEAQKKFYKDISQEEYKHYLALVDYREYLTDPVDWFTKVEHHSLDGG
jgi:rubrerythrin